MKTRKTMSKVLMLALAVMLVFAMSSPALAQDYFTTTNASYIQGTAPTYSSAIHVNLVVESRTINNSYIYKTISNVALTPSGGGQSFYVRDVLLAVQSDSSNYLTFKDSSGNTLTSSANYFYSVVDTLPNPDVTYGPTSRYAMDGWMFRINGQFPLERAGWGASIATAYVTDGDSINIYHDDASGPSVCADFAKITSVTDNGSNTLTVNVKASYQYYGPAPNYTWYINDFTNYQGVTVNVYDENGNYVTSGTTNSSGNVTLTVGSFGAHTYTVEVERTTFANGLIQNTTDEVVYTP